MRDAWKDILTKETKQAIEAQRPGVRLCFRKILRLAVDQEQNTGNQRTDARDDV